MRFQARHLEIGAWLLAGISLLLAFIAWGQRYDWRVTSTYQLFPLFGLLAFSLMWAHYVVSAIKQRYGWSTPRLRRFFEYTSLVVLIAILLHPGLLVYQLFLDGAGLPPGSYYEYVGPVMKLSVILGQVALIIFLAFELRRFFSGKPWLNYVLIASDAAILLAYIHALRLGGQLQQGWYRGVWLFYGVSLALALGYINYLRFARFRASRRA